MSQQLPQRTPALNLIWTSSPSDAEAAEVVALLTAAAAADDVDPISEAASLRLNHPASARHVLVRAPVGTLIAYGTVAERAERPSAEFVVHPRHRRRGIGGALLAELLDRFPGPMWVWAHGEHPGALRLAERAGLDRKRELLQLRRALADPLPLRPLPDGLVLRPLRPGQDEPAVVALNNRAFAWHPEQGRWDAGDLAAREAQPWFDPEGFLLAVDAQDRLHGFHWTKVHPGGLGEVYVIGVDPGAQGTGLGAALTVAGLEHLRRRRLPEVMLYVESDNVAALRTFGNLGFRRHHSDIEFLRA
ncbi:MAG: mycothiol synthase [Pseudonocardiaceae bacterium]